MIALVDIKHGEGTVDPARVEALCDFVASELSLPANAEVSVTYVDDDEMASLNSEFRGISGPTDVLSFECDGLDDGFPSPKGEDGESDDEPFALGDVIIAPDVASKQAEEYGNTLAGELDMLLIHGLLHLNGYDHIDDADAEEMEALQARMLDEWSKQAWLEGGVE